jgi:hypothetical protein
MKFEEVWGNFYEANDAGVEYEVTEQHFRG